MSDSVRRLSDAERQRAAVYEAAIAAAFAGDEARVLAAAQFREERLYREEYGTWENYCEKRWGRSKRRMDELIQAAQVQENLKSLDERQVAQSVPEEDGFERQSAQLVMPNSKQAVELAKLPEPNAEPQDADAATLEEEESANGY